MRWQKGVLKMLDVPNPLFIDNGDDVETNLSINVMHSYIMVGRLRNSFDFNGCNCIFGWLPSMPRACFDLHDDQPTLCFGD